VKQLLTMLNAEEIKTMANHDKCLMDTWVSANKDVHMIRNVLPASFALMIDQLPPDDQAAAEFTA